MHAFDHAAAPMCIANAASNGYGMRAETPAHTHEKQKYNINYGLAAKKTRLKKN